MSGMTEISLGNAGLVALMGYAVVFFGLVLLMIVITIMGKVMSRSTAKAAAASSEANANAAAPAPVKLEATPAPGTAGQLKLYDTDPRDAAMIMAIVADSLGKPINELRFISIREVKE